MFANLNGWHLLIVLALILLLFGAAKLPALARSVGQSARILKKEIHDGKADTVQTVDAAPVPSETRTSVSSPTAVAGGGGTAASG